MREVQAIYTKMLSMGNLWVNCANLHENKECRGQDARATRRGTAHPSSCSRCRSPSDRDLRRLQLLPLPRDDRFRRLRANCSSARRPRSRSTSASDAASCFSSRCRSASTSNKPGHRQHDLRVPPARPSRTPSLGALRCAVATMCSGRARARATIALAAASPAPARRRPSAITYASTKRAGSTPCSARMLRIARMTSMTASAFASELGVEPAGVGLRERARR